jgi:hypothetical protein
MSRSPRQWTADKKRLSFCRVSQDGDDEGCLELHGLPTPKQAKMIRAALGFRRRRLATDISALQIALGGGLPLRDGRDERDTTDVALQGMGA